MLRTVFLTRATVLLRVFAISLWHLLAFRGSRHAIVNKIRNLSARECRQNQDCCLRWGNNARFPHQEIGLFPIPIGQKKFSRREKFFLPLEIENTIRKFSDRIRLSADSLIA